MAKHFGARRQAYNRELCLPNQGILAPDDLSLNSIHSEIAQMCRNAPQPCEWRLYGCRRDRFIARPTGILSRAEAILLNEVEL